ncbi:hypothetical protein AB5I41_30040 [Sphingomonas sp. MMS24-JH45]
MLLLPTRSAIQPAARPGARMNISRDRVENGGLILFLVLATLGLAFVVSGFVGALLWAALAALLFQSLSSASSIAGPDRRNTGSGARPGHHGRGADPGPGRRQPRGGPGGGLRPDEGGSDQLRRLFQQIHDALP